MRGIDSKLPRVGTTIFTVMSRLAERHQAINLSQGFPDFQPPAELLARVERQLAAGYNQYAPMAGAVPLRAAIAEKLERCYGVRCNPDTEITVTSGATEALFCAVQATVRPGDEVVVFDPAYDSYEPAVTLAGGRTVHLPLAGPRFRIDWDRLVCALGSRTRLVIVNSPHNPTGAVLEHADLDRLAELLRPYDCWLLSDEVYEHVIFDGREHATVLAHAELAQRSFAVFSFGKTYHATGWKVGYCIAPPPLTEELRRVHQYVTFATAAPLQYALAEHLRERPEDYLTLPEFYGRKRDLFAQLLAASKFEVVPSAGTYFQLADYRAISNLGDVEFARRLTAEHGVAVIPVSVFYAQPPDARLVRFCFAKQERTLAQAAERLCALTALS